ncbi:MAG: lamin tail domain-containing protein, partial [Planctomycetota bacterium]
MPKCVRILSFVMILAAVLVGSAGAHCPAADLNRDCIVNLADLEVLTDQWLSDSGLAADLNGDDIVDSGDFALLADQWYESGVPLAINEFMASNGSTIADPQGQYDDWIEIHNYGPEAIDTGGMYLTDDLSAADKWRIPDNNPALTTVAAGGYLVIWADGDTTDAGLHASFKLDSDGDGIGLFTADGSTPVDSIVFDQQTRDISYGRYPDSGDSWRFFGTPTPAAQNSGGYLGEIETPKFSRKRGFYRAAFSVTLATETEDAVIYYTLDGSEPYQWGGRFMTGSVYQGPISIGRTTCLRAKAIRAGWKPSETETHTYIFLADVIRQSVSGAAPGLGWPAGSVNGQAIDYGMDPDVTNDARYRDLMDDAMLAVPTISVVTELASLFDPATGIYVHAGNDGRAWERPASVELINPDDSGGFQINAGLRIRGGFSRSNSNPKHAFRLFFRPEYGRAKLKFPLFEHEGADEFESVDLRTSQNYSWGFQNSSQNTMVREVFSRDVQGEMGHPYTRSRYYHLYINGQYWGLYQTQERSEASYAGSYLGGDKDDYDAVKVDRSVGRAMLATDGDMDAYRRLYDATKAVRGGRDRDAYYRVQGMNRDGTRNPEYERLLDVDNLIDFMIIEYYTGDRDGPGSRFGNIPNNTFSIYNRVNPDGWKFFHHDNEHTLGASSSEVNMVTPFTSAGSQWRYFNPHWLHEQLMAANADYRMRFADRVYKHFFNGGLLTPAASQLRIEARARQIELAIIAESARWGDSKRSTPFTRDDHWRPEVNRILYDYLPSRTNVVLNQFKAVGWYPNVDPPVFNSLGGHINKSFSLTMSAPTGTIYYTLDGSDPRSWDMLPDDGMDSVLVAEDADKRVLVPVRSPGDGWNDAGFSDTGWMRGSGSPGGVGYERGTGYESFISLDVGTQMYARNTTCYIRIPFIFGGRLDDFNFMALNIRYDDGFIAYLNGVEVARRNFNGTPAWNSNASASNSDSAAVLFESIDISAFLNTLQPGGNLLAIQGLNASTTSADFLISAELRAGDNSAGAGGDISPGAFEYNGPVTLTATRHVKASVLVGRGWSALNEAVFAVGPVAENLRITEIMYHPKTRANADEPNEEFIELKNIGTESVNLNLVSFTNGIDFTFPNVELAPGEYILVVQDRTAFE